MYFDDFEFDEEQSVADSEQLAQDIANQDVYSLGGDSNSYPLQTDHPPQKVASSGEKMNNGFDIGGFIKNLPAMGRDLGTVVGSVQNATKQAQANYNAAQVAAKTDNKLAQWWLYASMTDKLVVGLGVATLAYMIVKD